MATTVPAKQDVTSIRVVRHAHPVALTIDLAAAGRTVSDDELRAWASSHSVFLSSVMGEVAAERRAVAEALQDAGFSVRWFEEFGGRDDPAEQAYLSEVAASDTYLGILGDEYGGMLPTGFSATHAEYLEARERGKRISFWVRSEGGARAGHARNFLDEVRVFNVTGSFDAAADLPGRVMRRMREMAAEDLSPWVKIGDVVLRGERTNDSGSELRISARARDANVLRRLEELGPRQGWDAGGEVKVTYDDRSGVGRIQRVESETRSQAYRDVTLTLTVEWVTGGDPMAAGTTGYAAEDLTEVGVRTGLLGEGLPQQLGAMGFMVDTSDPLAELQQMQVPEGSVQPIARLLVAEALIGSRRAASIESFSLGPNVQDMRRLALGWREPRRYTNVEPGSRFVEGTRNWG